MIYYSSILLLELQKNQIYLGLVADPWLRFECPEYQGVLPTSR
jgi:hypothetical protein